MRSLPTRRDIAFGIAFVASILLILQVTKRDQTFGHDWSGKTATSWPGGSQSNRKDVSENTKGRNKPAVGIDPIHTKGIKASARKSALVWGTGKVPTTHMQAHVPGWTLFDLLYIFNGTVFIVTDEPKKLPDRFSITSSGSIFRNDPHEIAKQAPTDMDMQIISPEKATSLFGSYASRLDGTTFLINDPPQFINHYYHWSAEVLFGLWRVYSTLDPNITADGQTKLAAPRRILMPHVPYANWRDYASMNQWVTLGAFPSISLEFQKDWEDRASLDHPFVLERVVYADRAASMLSLSSLMTQRHAAAPFKLLGSPYWWRTIRNNLVEFAGSDPNAKEAKVITYVSRQPWVRRKLIPEDHRRLVAALEQLRDKFGYEVNIVNMEKLSRREQVQLAARTTIMMGVHGNGLTSLLWMKPTRRSTVMEFFYPGGFAQDYEWTTRALGMKHYSFWGDTYFTSPDLPPIDYPVGFQGDNITVDGELVARLCHERLVLPDIDP